jgi:hypothetical protein
MQFQAVVAGKVVSYPQSATFVIEQRKPHQSYALTAAKDGIESAICKFNQVCSRQRNVVKSGTATRLRFVNKGRFHTMLVEIR